MIITIIVVMENENQKNEIFKKYLKNTTITKFNVVWEYEIFRKYQKLKEIALYDSFFFLILMNL